MSADYYPVEAYRPATMECALASAARHAVPANIMFAVLQLEGSREGLMRRNSNGSIDFGRGQINTISFLDWQRRFQLSNDQINQMVYYATYDGCYSVDLVATLLQQRLSEPCADVWTCAANYHSKTPKHNQVYRAKLIPLASVWAQYLRTHYQMEEYTP